jgi:hypothetical protein
VLKTFVAAEEHVGAVTTIVGTAGVDNIAPPLYVKLADVAEHDEALVAVIVYEVPVVPPVITPPVPTVNPDGVEV